MRQHPYLQSMFLKTTLLTFPCKQTCHQRLPLSPTRQYYLLSGVAFGDGYSASAPTCSMAQGMLRREVPIMVFHMAKLEHSHIPYKCNQRPITKVKEIKHCTLKGLITHLIVLSHVFFAVSPHIKWPCHTPSSSCPIRKYLVLEALAGNDYSVMNSRTSCIQQQQVFQLACAVCTTCLISGIDLACSRCCRPKIKSCRWLLGQQ